MRWASQRLLCRLRPPPVRSLTVYALIGVLSAAIALAFALSPVGKGDRYLAEAAERRAERLTATDGVPT